MTVSTVEPKAQILAAVRLAREYRHSSACACGEYRTPSTEGFCNLEHARWNERIDKLIDDCRSGA